MLRCAGRGVLRVGGLALSKSRSNVSSFCINSSFINSSFINCGGTVTGGEVSEGASRSPMLLLGIALIAVALFTVAGVVFSVTGSALQVSVPRTPPNPLRFLNLTLRTDRRPTARIPNRNPNPRANPRASTDRNAADQDVERRKDLRAGVCNALLRRGRRFELVRDVLASRPLLRGRVHGAGVGRGSGGSRRCHGPAAAPVRHPAGLLGRRAGFTGEVLLTYSDGTTETVPVRAVYRGDDLKRYLTAEDVSYPGDLVEGPLSEEPYDGVAEAVEQFVYKYYDAVAAENWSATYAMLDSGGQGVNRASESPAGHLGRAVTRRGCQRPGGLRRILEAQRDCSPRRRRGGGDNGC